MAWVYPLEHGRPEVKKPAASQPAASQAATGRPPVAPTRIYRGVRKATGNVVEVITASQPSRPLDPRTDLRVYDPINPTVLEWGYAGASPAQLALAILADATGNRKIALAWHQDFKREVVAKFGFQVWTITAQDVHNWLVGATIRELQGSRPQDKPSQPG